MNSTFINNTEKIGKGHSTMLKQNDTISINIAEFAIYRFLRVI